MPTPPTLQNVKDYLTPLGAWTDAEITDARDAEIAAQVAVCRFPADPVLPAPPLAYPADLASALKRRVLRHLNTKNLGNAKAIPPDDEIRRLEAPHRRVVLG